MRHVRLTQLDVKLPNLALMKLAAWGPIATIPSGPTIVVDDPREPGQRWFG